MLFKWLKKREDVEAAGEAATAPAVPAQEAALSGGGEAAPLKETAPDGGEEGNAAPGVEAAAGEESAARTRDDAAEAAAGVSALQATPDAAGAGQPETAETEALPASSAHAAPEEEEEGAEEETESASPYGRLEDADAPDMPSKTGPEPAARGASRPEAEGPGSPLLTAVAVVAALALAALFSALAPERPAWLTWEPRILALAASGGWAPGDPSVTQYPLFNWLLVGLGMAARQFPGLPPQAPLMGASFIGLAALLLSTLCLAKAGGLRRSAGLGAVFILLSMSVVMCLAWFARPETLFTGLMLFSFGFLFLAAAREPNQYALAVAGAVAAVLAVWCAGVWGALLPILGVVLCCLARMRPARLFSMDKAVALGIIIGLPVLLWAACLLFQSQEAAQAYCDTLLGGFLDVRTLPEPDALWKTPLLFVGFALPWCLVVFLVSPRRPRSWLGTLPVCLAFLCCLVWSVWYTGRSVPGDATALLGALSVFAILAARWLLLFSSERTLAFLRVCALLLAVAGLAGIAIGAGRFFETRLVEDLLPVPLPDAAPYWAFLATGGIGIAAGALVWLLARSARGLNAILLAAVALMVVVQGAGHLLLPHVAASFSFSRIGEAIRTCEERGERVLAVGLPAGSFYTWSDRVGYVASPDQLSRADASAVLVMPEAAALQEGVDLASPGVVRQTVGGTEYVLVPPRSSSGMGGAGRAEPWTGEEPGGAAPEAADDAAPAGAKPGAQPFVEEDAYGAPDRDDGQAQSRPEEVRGEAAAEADAPEARGGEVSMPAEEERPAGEPVQRHDAPPPALLFDLHDGKGTL